MARTTAQRQSARENVHANRDRIIKRYRGDESMNALASAFGVGPAWLAEQFDEWKEPRRNMAAAQALRRANRKPRTESEEG